MYRTLIAFVTLAFACFARAEDNVLLWFLDEPDVIEIGGGTVSVGDLVGRGEAAGKQVNAVRIKAMDDAGNSVYLSLGADASSFDSWDSFVRLPYQYEGQDYFWAGPGGANLNDLSKAGMSLDSVGLTFAMELGNATFTDGVLTEWTVLALGTDTLETLRQDSYIVNELSYMGEYGWQAGQFVVPEPTSGMLVLIGGALLALRRRRKDLAA